VQRATALPSHSVKMPSGWPPPARCFGGSSAILEANATNQADLCCRAHNVGRSAAVEPPPQRVGRTGINARIYYQTLDIGTLLL
jgi:hypothetical protein